MSSFSQTFTGQTAIVITHNLGTENVIIQARDSSNVIITPGSITITSVNTVSLTFVLATTGTVLITTCDAVNPSGTFAQSTGIDAAGTIFDAVRIDIGDSEGVIFNIAYLQRLLLKAVRRLNHRLGISVRIRGPKGVEGQFGGRRIKLIPITVDIETGTITPATDEYEDLVIMMMEFIIVTSELSALKRLNGTTAGPFAATVQSASQDGITVTNADGVTVSIQGGRLSNRVSMNKFDVETRKEELDMAIKMYLGRLSGGMGKMVW